MSKPRTHWWVVVDKEGFPWKVVTDRRWAVCEKEEQELHLACHGPYKVIKVQEVMRKKVKK